MQQIAFKRLHPDAILPVYAHPGDAGLDICAVEHVTLAPGDFVAVATGWAIALPPNTECQVRPRSGLAAKHGIGVVNAPGTIDEGYRGEIKVILINHGHESFVIEPGMRIAQLVIAPVLRVSPVECDTLSDTVRGTGGFGSTGV